MTDHFDQARKLVSDAIIELENRADQLESEQQESEDVHDAWDEDEKTHPDERGDEPDVLDHQGEIDRINRTVNFLEKAVDELAED